LIISSVKEDFINRYLPDGIHDVEKLPVNISVK
jgi:hypothetical protein